MSAYEKLAAQVKLSKIGDLYWVTLGAYIAYSCTQTAMDLYSVEGKAPAEMVRIAIDTAMEIMCLPADAMIQPNLATKANPHCEPVPAADAIKELLAMVA